MPAQPPSREDKIAVIGSGVFGISTALWLARYGYRDVTVFDMQDTHETGYDPEKGVDSASADINKIIRFSYGSQIAYQRLATQAAEIWDQWNDELAKAVEESPETLPPTLRRWEGQPRLWYKSGMCRMSATDEMPAFEIETLDNMEKEGLRQDQFRSDDDSDVQRAQRLGLAKHLDPFDRLKREGFHKAVLDVTAGFTVAYRSCAWAQHLARRAGVKFVLHPQAGRVVNIGEKDGKPVVHTADASGHLVDLAIVAGGGWTPGLLPEVNRSLEATAGSVLTIKFPPERRDLWDRFSPENFPVCTMGMYEGTGIYMLPRTPEGVLKIAYRAKKWTNFASIDGRRVSVPKTAHVTAEKESNIPLEALDAMKGFITKHLPELRGLDISATKMCWYTDSVDDSFMVDRVPGRSGVMVCSGGSGHGFKFLPILGREVVNIIENPQSDGEYRTLWKWRDADSVAERKNGLEEGETGPRVLSRLQMASEKDWKIEWPSGFASKL